jgi:hypothetical protein
MEFALNRRRCRLITPTGRIVSFEWELLSKCSPPAGKNRGLSAEAQGPIVANIRVCAVDLFSELHRQSLLTGCMNLSHRVAELEARILKTENASAF